MNCWQKLTDMEDLPKVNSELQKRYKDTWLQFRSSAWNETKFGMFLGNNHDDNYYVKILGEGTVTLPFKHSEDLEISVPKPETGCYTDEVTRSLMTFSVLPHRQWKRGLYKGNAIIMPAIKAYNEGNNIFGDAITSVLVPKENKELDDAIAFMDKEQFYGYALNRSFGITLNFSSENDTYLILFYKHFIVGKVLRGKKTIIVENDIFLQEILDTKHKWCPNYEVEVHG